MAREINRVWAACRTAGWEVLELTQVANWTTKEVSGCVNGRVLTEQVERLNGSMSAVEAVFGWLKSLPHGIDGTWCAWRGLTEGVDGYQLVNWPFIPFCLNLPTATAHEPRERT
jgi:hypothetical protein